MGLRIAVAWPIFCRSKRKYISDPPKEKTSKCPRFSQVIHSLGMFMDEGGNSISVPAVAEDKVSCRINPSQLVVP